MRILSVSDFLGLVNETLKALSEYDDFGVEGEVSGYRVSQGQWVNFDLKDDDGLVNIFMPIWKLKIPLEDGMRVRVIGVARVYPKYGKFSLSAETVEPIGEGAIKKALAALRARLAEEGLFDVSRKRQLLRIPRRIALIASRESAAYGDFTRIVHERWPLLEIDLFHVIVQGEKAPADIIKALKTVQSLQSEKSYDAIVITRGGGSFDELMAFNDESLTRAIHASAIPTLVAIGHERDVSLAEEVADVRASTPTDAARRLVPDQRDVLYELSTMTSGILQTVEREIGEKRLVIDRVLQSGIRLIDQYQNAVQGARQMAMDQMTRWQGLYAERVDSMERLFKSLDPKAVLGRGYAFIRDAKGHVLGSVDNFSKGQAMEIQLKDGTLGASVQVIQRK